MGETNDIALINNLKDNKNWSFDDYDTWDDIYLECSSKTQTPINIITESLINCKILCKLGITYKKTKCEILKINNIPMIKFYNINEYKNRVTDSLLVFKEKSFNLKMATIHTPSLHKIDGESYDAEICLYHDIDEQECVIMSCLFQEGDHHGAPEIFINEIINSFPKDDIDVPKNVKCSMDWGPKMILPKRKAFYTYTGGLPFPPCVNTIGDKPQKVTWIIFEQIGTLGKTTLETLRFNLGKNVRPIQPLNSRNIYYNSNIELNTEHREEKITNPIEIRDERYLKCIPKTGEIVKKVVKEQPKEMDMTRIEAIWRVRIKNYVYCTTMVFLFISAYKLVLAMYASGKAQKLLEFMDNSPHQTGGNIFTKIYFKITQMTNRMSSKHSFNDIINLKK